MHNVRNRKVYDIFFITVLVTPIGTMSRWNNIIFLVCFLCVCVCFFQPVIGISDADFIRSAFAYEFGLIYDVHAKHRMEQLCNVIVMGQ